MKRIKTIIRPYRFFYFGMVASLNMKRSNKDVSFFFFFEQKMSSKAEWLFTNSRAGATPATNVVNKVNVCHVYQNDNI